MNGTWHSAYALRCYLTWRHPSPGLEPVVRRGWLHRRLSTKITYPRVLQCHFFTVERMWRTLYMFFFNESSTLWTSRCTCHWSKVAGFCWFLSTSPFSSNWHNSYTSNLPWIRVTVSSIFLRSNLLLSHWEWLSYLRTVESNGTI